MSSKISKLFHERIGYAGAERIRFDQLEQVLTRTALSIPFENLCIVENRSEPISRDSLVRKIVQRGEGGLCYELNPLLYFYLLEQGFAVRMVRGAVYNAGAGHFSPTGRTHVAILLDHEGQAYLVDTGFGTNLPLKPVPLTGEAVHALTGQFRVVQRSTEYGDFVFEMKLKHKDDDWQIGYAFDSRKPLDGLSELEEVRAIIVDHPDSSFNKHRLITQLTERGSVTLTDNSLTRWEDGEQHKDSVDKEAFARYRDSNFVYGANAGRE